MSQVFRSIIGLRDTEPVNEMYEASAGLLLRNDIHKLFDNLELSFYFKVGMSFCPSHNITLILAFYSAGRYILCSHVQQRHSVSVPWEGYILG